MLGNDNAAYDVFYKSTWNAAWQDAAFLNLARIASSRGAFDEALDLVEKSLVRNYNSHIARHLKTSLLRKLNRISEAAACIENALAIDRFNIGCMFEQYLITDDKNQKKGVLQKLQQLIRGNVHTYLAFALDYAHAGMFQEASELLKLSITDPDEVYPMAYYYLAYFAHRQNNHSEAQGYAKMASLMKPDYCFPNRIEDVNILTVAQELSPNDSRAPFYLGNFWYAHRQYEDAIACWERSRRLDDKFATVHRNLALALHNKRNDADAALQSLEKAFELDQTDARVLMELDQLYKKMNKPHRFRLALLEKHLNLTEYRDDLYLERVTLYNQLGQHERARQLIAARKFHPWEGGEGKVVGQFLICHLELAKVAIMEGEYQKAINLLKAAEVYPHNLGEGKLYGTRENDLHYLMGCAYDGLGQKAEAQKFFTTATAGSTEPVQAIFYNDQQPDKIFYQGLAYRKLGQHEKAEQIFRRLIDFGKEHMNDHIKIDYFAVSLPDLLVFDQDLNLKNRIHCHYMMGLGYLGLGNGEAKAAEKHFTDVLQMDINHQGAMIHKNMIQHSTLVEA